MQWDCGFDSPYNSILVHVLLVEARNICSATERSSISHRNKLLMELAVHRHCRVVVKFSNTFRESEGEASYLRKRLLCRSPPLTNSHPTPTKLDPAVILSLLFIPRHFTFFASLNTLHHLAKLICIFKSSSAKFLHFLVSRMISFLAQIQQ